MEPSIVSAAGARLRAAVTASPGWIVVGGKKMTKAEYQAQQPRLAAEAAARRAAHRAAGGQTVGDRVAARAPVDTAVKKQMFFPSGIKKGGATRADFAAAGEGFEDEDSSDWFYGFIFLVFIVFILSPGVLLTIPPGRGGLFMSGKTSIIAALVHALIIVLITSSI